jgi:RNA recognition motif-containing protein
LSDEDREVLKFFLDYRVRNCSEIISED